MNNQDPNQQQYDHQQLYGYTTHSPARLVNSADITTLTAFPTDYATAAAAGYDLYRYPQTAYYHTGGGSSGYGGLVEALPTSAATTVAIVTAGGDSGNRLYGADFGGGAASAFGNEYLRAGEPQIIPIKIELKSGDKELGGMKGWVDRYRQDVFLILTTFVNVSIEIAAIGSFFYLFFSYFIPIFSYFLGFFHKSEGVRK
jgi:hypothetical protein